MILTAKEIIKEQDAGHIGISPFDPARLNPCSYTYRLGPQLGVPNLARDPVGFDNIDIPPEGYVLQPGRMYLGHTLEILGSDHYVMSLVGRSSLGRLGMFLQVSANLINVGTSHQVTLELVVAIPLRIYAGMDVGEISFWQPKGEVKPYRGRYTQHNAPTASHLAESS